MLYRRLEEKENHNIKNKVLNGKIKIIFYEKKEIIKIIAFKLWVYIMYFAVN